MIAVRKGKWAIKGEKCARGGGVESTYPHCESVEKRKEKLIINIAAATAQRFEQELKNIRRQNPHFGEKNAREVYFAVGGCKLKVGVIYMSSKVKPETTR